MSDLIYFDAQAQSLLKTGVAKICDAVSSTMGPRGKLVLIEKQNEPPHLTKDGATVAKHINLSDRVEALGARLLRQASENTATVAGDGSTTSTVLAKEIYFKASQALQTGVGSPSELTSLISVSQATKMTIFNKSNLLDNQILQDVIIHNGVPIAPKNKNLNKPVNEKKIFRVGIISRIEKYKGHEDLIIAITKLNKHYLKKFKFEIIGSGDENYLRYLTKLVERNELSSSIHFLGYVKKQINEIIENLDLVVSTTRTFEGFGLSIIEAINLNVPVITTNVGAIPEYLDKDKCEIIPPSSPEELANSLKNFIDKNNEWNNRAYVAKKYLDENLNSDLMGEKYIKHFENNLKL